MIALAVLPDQNTKAIIFNFFIPESLMNLPIIRHWIALLTLAVFFVFSTTASAEAFNAAIFKQGTLAEVEAAIKSLKDINAGDDQGWRV